MISPLNQIIKYVSVGVAINLIGFSVYIFIANFALINPPIAAILAGIIVLPFSYYLNKKFTFQQAYGSYRLELSYYVLYVSAICLNALNIWIFSSVMGFSHEITAGVSLIAITILNFIIQKFYIFRQ